MLRSAPTTYYKHHRPLFSASTRRPNPTELLLKKQQIAEELRAAGAARYGLMHGESRELPYILQDDEHIKGMVYGHSEDGFAVLLATNKRVLFIDKSPPFVKAEHISYEEVEGISHDRIGPLVKVTLHTAKGPYRLRTWNSLSAKHFADFIAFKCLTHKTQRGL